jgi:hypothetical protein
MIDDTQDLNDPTEEPILEWDRAAKANYAVLLRAYANAQTKEAKAQAQQLLHTTAKMYRPKDSCKDEDPIDDTPPGFKRSLLVLRNVPACQAFRAGVYARQSSPTTFNGRCWFKQFHGSQAMFFHKDAKAWCVASRLGSKTVGLLAKDDEDDPCDVESWCYVPTPAAEFRPSSLPSSAEPSNLEADGQPGSDLGVQHFAFDSVDLAKRSFDKGGLLYHLGTKGGTAKYENPGTMKGGGVKVTSNGSMSEGRHAYITRQTNPDKQCYTRNSDEAFICLDLGADVMFKAQHYAIRSDTRHTLRNWRLEGSIDGKKWAFLRVHEEEHTAFQGAKLPKLGHWEVPGCRAFYRYYRLCPFRNSDGKRGNTNNCERVFCGGIELYGQLDARFKTAVSLQVCDVHEQINVRIPNGKVTTFEGLSSVMQLKQQLAQQLSEQQHPAAASRWYAPSKLELRVGDGQALPDSACVFDHALKTLAQLELKQSEDSHPEKRLVKKLESEHQYAHNLNEMHELQLPGASEMTITFSSKCRTESGSDFVRFWKDAERNESITSDISGSASNFPGAKQGGKEALVIEGDVCYMQWHTDGSVSDWGWELSYEGLVESSIHYELPSAPQLELCMRHSPEDMRAVALVQSLVRGQAWRTKIATKRRSAILIQHKLLRYMDQLHEKRRQPAMRLQARWRGVLHRNSLRLTAEGLRWMSRMRQGATLLQALVRGRNVRRHIAASTIQRAGRQKQLRSTLHERMQNLKQIVDAFASGTFTEQQREEYIESVLAGGSTSISELGTTSSNDAVQLEARTSPGSSDSSQGGIRFNVEARQAIEIDALWICHHTSSNMNWKISNCDGKFNDATDGDDWDEAASGSGSYSRGTIRRVELDSPLRVEKDQFCGIYIHSDDSSGIAFQSANSGEHSAEDDCLRICKGQCMLTSEWSKHKVRRLSANISDADPYDC